MNRVRWAAWGVVDIEKLERMQRRNYIKAVRLEIQPNKLECGGSSKQPWYQFLFYLPDGGYTKMAYAGPEGFKKACQWLLEQLGEGHERSTDGSVWCAGDEAEGNSSVA